MNFSWKSMGAGAILIAVVGCAGDDQSQPAPPVLAAPTPPTSANGGTGSQRPSMAAEMQPTASASATATTNESKPGAGPQVEGPKLDADKPAAGKSGPTAEQLTAIKELSEADQQIAMRQVSCPVSGEPLGSMGKPWKTSAEGRSFFLCCKGCEKDVKADPKGVLAKLDKKAP